MRGLITYLDAIKRRDPAPRSRWEILTYPGLWAVAYHRVAHRLYRHELFLLARLVNHWSRMVTGIDIHPGARIGRHLFIDHGWVVIGETSVIGDGVTIYQNATLGGTNPTNGVAGNRHPTLEDEVIVSSGAQVLGPITVGRGAKVGANAVVTRDVVPGATVVGIPAKPLLQKADDYRPGFVPYGTPCEQQFDPQTQKLELLRCEMDALRARLDALEGEERRRTG